MNSMQVKDKLRNISNRQNVEFNIILRNYMYERFIERLANSEYKDNFVLKGGYLLSTIFGLNNRQIIDIDLCLKNELLTKDNIYRIINEIIEVDVGDIAVINIEDISPIRTEDEYGGYRLRMIVKIENIRESFDLDIATGDLITPREIIFKYQTMFDYKFIDLNSYNFETILAEKMETILSRLEFSSRMKDYYDVYLIYTLAYDKINIDILKQAVYNTFKKREFNGDVVENFKIIKDSDILRKKWLAYARHNKYTNNITYEEVIECLDKLIKIIEPVVV